MARLMKRTPNHNARTEAPIALPVNDAPLVILNKGQLWNPQAVRAVNVSEGSVWVTLKGDAQDYVLGPGDTLTLEAETAPVFEALSRATLHFE
ncbi:MAG TPA: DUF2917 domain-containing protein [Bdellovibrionales bacterium]|nr:DUF2917 domain-containing protein [Bdellovibrionales bacterium]